MAAALEPAKKGGLVSQVPKSRILPLAQRKAWNVPPSLIAPEEPTTSPRLLIPPASVTVPPGSTPKSVIV
jgi:hypothetical protein